MRLTNKQTKEMRRDGQTDTEGQTVDRRNKH